jgi:putative intracellular protease/amidase
MSAPKNRIISAEGLEITADKILNNLNGYDFIVVPGENKNIIYDEEFIEWIKTAQDKSIITSVCRSSIIFGLAGLLKDKKSHYSPYADGLS